MCPGTCRVSLDLIATVSGRLGTAPVEHLDGTDWLREWLVGGGLVPASQRVDADDRWLDAVRATREVLHRVVHTELGGGTAADADLSHLNRHPRSSRPSGTPTASCGAASVTLEGILSVVAADALSLLTGAHRGDLRECEGDTCDLVFLDTSRGHRRRWCSGTACVNRHRAARASE